MRKIIVASMLVLGAVCGYCFDFNTAEFYVKTDIEEGIYASRTELIYIREGLAKPEIVSRTPRPKNLYNQYGFLELRLGAIQVFVIDLNGLLTVPQRVEITPDEMNSYGINSNIRIAASGNLQESIGGKTVSYKPEYILRRMTREKEIGEYLYWSALPWAVDIKKDHVPSLTVNLESPADSFSILNGYIDFAKPQLYLDNSRIRKIRVIDLDTQENLGEYSLTDTIHYQKIALPRKARNIRLEITETYPGGKYTDLCVSSLIFDAYYNDAPGDYGKNQIADLREILGLSR